jgi:hypothetical protein
MRIEGRQDDIRRRKSKRGKRLFVEMQAVKGSKYLDPWGCLDINTIIKKISCV